MLLRLLNVLTHPLYLLADEFDLNFAGKESCCIVSTQEILHANDGNILRNLTTS